MTPEEEQAAKLAEEQARAAESARLEEIEEQYREGGFEEEADIVSNMATMDEFFEKFRGRLRLNLRDAAPELTEELLQEHANIIAEREAEAERIRMEEAEVENERRDSLTDEEREQETEVVKLQETENVIQAMLDETATQLEDQGDWSEPPGRIDPYHITDLKPMPDGGFVKPFHKPTALDAIKEIATELVTLPPAVRRQRWAELSEPQKAVLERGFGIRGPITAAELQKEES